ncbi:MAG TPA: YitT family protein [Candidatus Lachnoclostridium stercoripullorum]|uniref:YitT family protein n=1 Tax=Candidatus Lachnoclostridium stercoripullorum TaxID=2838635 RepID=A0A9D1W4V1_9FIRM|nr:YitT family protein [Candidatus Lachnoclostridium stercoripullorum]
MWKKRTAAQDYLIIVLGAFIMGFAIKNIYDPQGLVTGGVSGLAIILKDQAGIPLWITNMCVNVPLFFLSLRLKGWKFVKRVLVAEAALTVSLAILPEYAFLKDDLILTALFGGVFSGVGTGMMLLCHATTGGTDTMAALIHTKLRHYSINQILQVLDGLVVVAGAGVFGVRYAFYAVIAVVVLAKVSDGMIEGMHFAKAAYIITDYKEQISREIMDHMERGVTLIDASGAYTGEKRDIVFCVVSKKEIVTVKEIVRRTDPRAFVIVSDVREVLGEGFMEYRQ